MPTLQFAKGLQDDFSFFLVSHHRIRLEKEAEELTKIGDTESDRLMEVYERLEELDSATAETKAARILFGLGGCGT